MKKHYFDRKYKKKQIPFNDKMGHIRIDLCSDYEEILESSLGLEKVNGMTAKLMRN